MVSPLMSKSKLILQMNQFPLVLIVIVKYVNGEFEIFLFGNTICPTDKLLVQWQLTCRARWSWHGDSFWYLTNVIIPVGASCFVPFIARKHQTMRAFAVVSSETPVDIWRGKTAVQVEAGTINPEPGFFVVWSGKCFQMNGKNSDDLRSDYYICSFVPW